MSSYALSIVIPAYNEADRLSATLSALLARFGGESTEIVVVDDGSHDATAAVARQILGKTPNVRVLRLPSNRGKGAAVRAGVLASTGDAVMFMDADLATDLTAVSPALDALSRAHVVVGSRAVPGSVVREATMTRAIMGRVFNRMVRVLSRLDVHDTQCGFKAFRGPVARLLFTMSREDGFAFDAEVLIHARILGFDIVEIPVDWTAVEGSSVRPVLDSFTTARRLLRCCLRARPGRVRAEAGDLGWHPDTVDLAERATQDVAASSDDARRRDGSTA